VNGPSFFLSKLFPVFILVVLLTRVTPGWGQEDIDSLFESPEAGTVEATEEGSPALPPSSTPEEPEEQPEASPAPVDHLSAFTREALTIYGSLYAAAGGLGGYTELPPFNEPARMVDDIDFSGYAEFSNTLSFRARMDRYTSVQGSFLVEYPNFAFTVDELFLTYVLKELFFFRIGKQIITWGNGRIYDDTNLTLDAEDGYSFKLTVPVSTATLTAVVMDQPAWRYTENPGAEDLNYAGQLTVPVAGIEFLFSGLYASKRRRDSGFTHRGIVGLKTTLFTVDLFHESLLDTEKQYTALSGFFKEWSNPRIQLYGEHRYITGPDLPNDHQTSLNFLWRGFPHSKLDLGFRWNHAWRDNSGYVVPGLKWNNPAPNLTLAFAMPIYYGEPDSVIAPEFSDDVDSQFRKLSFGAQASLSVRY